MKTNNNILWSSYEHFSSCLPIGRHCWFNCCYQYVTSRMHVLIGASNVCSTSSTALVH